MKIAIIGANGSVGVELCLIARQQGETIIPVVRNALGAAYLRQEGFACRIADMGESRDAPAALAGAELVVISSNMQDDGGSSPHSYAVNRRIIENAIRFSPGNAVIVYFSSIRAFSHAIDSTAPRFFIPSYDQEKRWLERDFHQFLAREQRKGYCVRLGHVFGTHQGRAQAIKRLLQGKKIRIAAEPRSLSNVVHVVTIFDALLQLGKGQATLETYTLINSPAWTWEDVMAHYAPAGEMPPYSFVGLPSLRSSGLGIASRGWTTVKALFRRFAGLRMYLPSFIEKWVRSRYVPYQVSREMAEIDARLNAVAATRFDSPMFSYSAVPGPFIPNLPETKKRLVEISIPRSKKRMRA